MSRPPRCPVWRAWLLLMVAVWVNFAPLASAGAQVATARVSLSVTDGLPQVVGVYKYLYAHADPVRFSDPSGHFSIAGLSATSAITLTLAFLATPAPLNAPAPGDPIYSDTSQMDLAINIVGGKLIGEYVIGPIVSYTVRKIGNVIFPRAVSQVTSGAGGNALSARVASTFENSAYSKVVTSRPMIVYRAEGGSSKAFGKWFGTEKPLNAVDAEIMGNIMKYGNEVLRVATYEIPAGTTIYIGRVAGGAGQQIFIAEPIKVGVRQLASEALQVGLTGFGL